MTPIVEQVANHPIHESLVNLFSVLNEFDQLPDELLRSSIVERDYVKQVASEVMRRLSNTDPALISIGVLNNINSAFVSILAELRAFLKNKNKANVSNSISYVTTVLNHMAGIPVPTNIADVDAMREAITAFRRSVAQQLRLIEEKSSTQSNGLQQLDTSYKALEQRMSEQQKRLDTIVSEAQKAFSSAEDLRQKEFRQFVDERSKLASTENAQRAKDWDGFCVSKRQELATLITDAQKEVMQFKIDTGKQIHSFIDEITELKSTAERLVGIISNTGLIGGYQKEANLERGLASCWKIIAMLALLGLIFSAGWAFKTTVAECGKPAFSWALLGMRVFVALSCGALAAYAALQGERHEKAQRRYRKMELELASFTPFLHDLPEKDRQSMKMDLAKRIFGQADEVQPEPEGKTTGTALDLVKMALESVTKVINK